MQEKEDKKEKSRTTSQQQDIHFSGDTWRSVSELLSLTPSFESSTAIITRATKVARREL